MEIGKTDLASESAVINEDEEFYENLEAPKFVDLRAPDPLRCDDGTWFCVQIGCDQNHEHVDPEDLQKNFMLRVMAARSPNVRRTLKQRSNLKCPHSAPAKQPRSRLFKLSTATEIPDKIQNSKLKNHPISNLKSPSPIKKKIEEKTFTTPKAQNSNSKIPKPKIQNSSGSVFFSAKPNFSVKPKKEQIKEVCAKMRKLNLNNLQGGKRKSVPSRYLAGQISKKENDSKKENEEKMEINGKKKKSLRPLWKLNKINLKQNEEKSDSKKENEEKLEINGKKKSLRPLWKLNKPNLKQNEEKSDPKVQNLSKKTELEKLGLERKSLRPVRKSVKPVLKQNLDDKKKENLKVKEENLKSEKSMENLEPEDLKEENLKTEERKKKLEKENLSEENLKFENVKEENEKYEKNKEENIAESNMESFEGSNENKENVLNNSAKRDETENGNMKQNKKKRSLWFKANENSPPQKVVKVEKKNFQVKTTNPKPFRFRTDERGILKEANLEKKKLNELEPQKEMTNLPLNGQQMKNKSRNETGTARVKKVVPIKIKYQMKENQTEKIAEKQNKNSLVPKKEKTGGNLKRNLNENKIIAKEPRFHALSVPKSCVKRAEISVN